MSDSMILSRLQRRVGRSSKIAGIGFIALSIAFLILSIYDQFIVFEVDSIVAFLVAAFLLFKDPRARVQARVLDAMLISSNQAIRELSENRGAGFTYLPAGDNVQDVVVAPTRFAKKGLPTGTSESKTALILTPPGRSLAVLFRREAGLARVTMDSISSSLPEVAREDFGLAKSVEISVNEERVEVTFTGASSTCACGEAQTQPKSGGFIGCTVASFLAVLIASATKRAVDLEKCLHDPVADKWRVSMTLGPTYQVAS